jgi:hypothetical protein
MTVQLHPADINQARRGLKRNKKAAVAEGKQGDLVKTSAKSDVTAPLPFSHLRLHRAGGVFEHIPPITTGQYRIAITARSLATDGFWSRFTPDHLIKSASVCKGEERQRPAARHDYAPKKPFDLSSLGLRANEFPTDRPAD